jgi:hypothetical protein
MTIPYRVHDSVYVIIKFVWYRLIFTDYLLSTQWFGHHGKLNVINKNMFQKGFKFR